MHEVCPGGVLRTADLPRKTPDRECGTESEMLPTMILQSLVIAIAMMP